MFWKLLNDFGFCLSHFKSLSTGFNCICKQRDIWQRQEMRKRLHEQSWFPFSKPLPYFVSSFFTIFSHLFFDSTLSPHGCNYCSVSWEKSRWKIGQRKQRVRSLFLSIFISLLSSNQQRGKREVLTPFLWYITKRKKGKESERISSDILNILCH